MCIEQNCYRVFVYIQVNKAGKSIRKNQESEEREVVVEIYFISDIQIQHDLKRNITRLFIIVCD